MPLSGNWDSELELSGKFDAGSSIPIKIGLFLAKQLFASTTHTAQEPGSLFWCHAVLSLQFTHVCSFACKDKLPYLRRD